jgi:hypothetical protein
MNKFSSPTLIAQNGKPTGIANNNRITRKGKERKFVMSWWGDELVSCSVVTLKPPMCQENGFCDSSFFLPSADSKSVCRRL